ncbi:MAG: diaminopimelate epimerase [Pseudomonadota bacterium]
MKLRFTKMHGLGNDFVVIDAIDQYVSLGPEQVRMLANRRFGVGCDQVLLVESPNLKETDFRYRIFNADGNEVEQCGNGARCFARYVMDNGLTDSNKIVVETKAGVIKLKIEPDGQVSVNMGIPILNPDEIPFKAPTRALTYMLSVTEQKVEISAVSMGNPHAVIRVNDIDTAPVSALGPRIESHHRFPNQVNVGFMQVMDQHNIRLRVYERGTGETLACGTGACAAVVAGRLQSFLGERVAVDLPGGRLMISWSGAHAPVMMTGPASYVFKGSIDL